MRERKLPVSMCHKNTPSKPREAEIRFVCAYFKPNEKHQADNRNDKITNTSSAKPGTSQSLKSNSISQRRLLSNTFTARSSTIWQQVFHIPSTCWSHFHVCIDTTEGHGDVCAFDNGIQGNLTPRRNRAANRHRPNGLNTPNPSKPVLIRFSSHSEALSAFLKCIIWWFMN